MRIVVGTALAGAVAVVGLVLAGVAVGAPTWGAPVQLAPSATGDGNDSAYDADVAMDPAGDAAVGWVLRTVGLPTGFAEAVFRTAGSAVWSSPADLAESAESGPSLAIDSAGDALGVFFIGGWPLNVQASDRLGLSGAWQDPVTLSPQADGVFGPWVAVGPGGDAGVLAIGYTGHSFVLQGTVRPAGTMIWKPLDGISDPSGNADATRRGIALDAAGNAIAMWTEQIGGRSIVQASFRPRGSASWGAPVDVASGYLEESPQVAFDGAGNATAIWIHFLNLNGLIEGQVESSYRPFGGTWGPPVAISLPSTRLVGCSLAINRAGDTVAVWADGGLVKSVARRGSSNTWPTLDNVTNVSSDPSSGAASPEVAINQTGNAVAIWEGHNNVVQAALRPAANGVWQSPVELARHYTDSTHVAIDATSHALAIWNEGGVIKSSDLTSTGPVLTQVGIPADGTVRIPARFSVVAAPWASPLRGDPVWRFGDGTLVTGTAVSHVYANPGRYTVSVTQADTTGTSSATGSITVEAPTLQSLSQPSVHGAPKVGRTLLCLTGIWTGTAPIRYRYAWLRNHAPIPGAHQRRYAIRQRDGGTAISCRVTASNPAGSMSKLSRPVLVRR